MIGKSVKRKRRQQPVYCALVRSIKVRKIDTRHGLNFYLVSMTHPTNKSHCNHIEVNGEQGLSAAMASQFRQAREWAQGA